MIHPEYGRVKKLWCSLGKPYRSSLIRLNNVWKYNIKKYPCQYTDMKTLLDVDSPIIVDGGAGSGDTIVEFKQYFPHSTIFAFEPIQTVEAEQTAKQYTNVNVINSALGESNGYIDLHETHYPDASSVLVHKYEGIKKHASTKRIVNAQLVSLDSWCEDNYYPGIDILKLDIQGYELFALKGAKHLLKSTVQLAYVECCLKEWYVGQPSFLDVCNYMKSIGFEIYKIYGFRNTMPVFVDVLFKKVKK